MARPSLFIRPLEQGEMEFLALWDGKTSRAP
jgi:hypothetical protein